MKRAPRPKFSTLLLSAASLLPVAARAQSPLASAYATRDGHAPTSVLGCPATDGSFTAQPCGVTGHPLHVQVDSTVSTGAATPTTAPGAASAQVVGVQGVGGGALPIAVSQSGAWTLALPNGSHLALDAGGNVIGGVSQSGSWAVSVSNLPATQPVSVVALPLPAGAATAAAQGSLNADGGKQVHVTNLPATQPVSGSVSVSNLPATQTVSAVSLPLPAGAATAVAQGSLNADGGKLVHVTNLPATQPVSGSVNVSNFPATQAVSAVALPLPTGAATIAAQGTINADGGKQVHVTNLLATQPVSGSVSVSNFPAAQAVSAAALPLPAGAATAANQSAVNADGGSQVHVVNFPASQAVTGSVVVTSMPALAAGSNTIGTVVQSLRSNAWTDASFTATGTASAPAALAAVSARTGLHVWNLGSATACMNYTASAAVSGSTCASGSVPIPAGSAYLEDQPGNVSPEAISLVCAGSSCPLTIKVR